MNLSPCRSAAVLAALGGVLVAAFARAAAQAAPEDGFSKQDVVVYKQEGVYACFPSLVQTPDGTLYTQFGTRHRIAGNIPHVDTTGGSARYVSRDGGLTWQPTADPMPADPAGRTRDGGSASVAAEGWVEIPAEKRAEYRQKGYLTNVARPGVAAYLGSARVAVRSPGGKVTRRPLPGAEQASLMGFGEPLRTRSGVHLTPLYGWLRRPLPGKETSYAIRSEDDGKTWRIVTIAAPIKDEAGNEIGFNETSLMQLPDGRIVAMMRPSPDSVGYLYEAVSSDDGATWTAPVKTPIWGFPANLLVLKNGDLLCTYGYRRAPMGVRACVSHDGGATWDIAHEVVLRDDGAGHGADLGYPRTKQNADGSLCTIYYMTNADLVTHVEATIWRLPAGDGAAKGAPVAETTTEGAPIAISHGGDAGTYAAFPDLCRLKDGSLAAVFYAGYQHVSVPKEPDWPNGGRICIVVSKDEGHTWSKPRTVYDDALDDRDPHIAQMPDGRVVLTLFSPGVGVEIATSSNGGKSFDKQARPLSPKTNPWYESAPVRVLPSGTWLQGVYHFQKGDVPEIYGGVLRSTDQGKTWSEPIPIGKGSGIPLDAETDVITLKDGSVFAALRSGTKGVNLHYATSKDDGLTWSPVQDAGFHGESPYLYRLSDGAILLAVRRRPDTVLYVSRDETKTWQGPYPIDNVLGGYPSIAELKDGTALIVYYTEGQGSEVRARRFRVLPDGIQALPL